MHSIGHTAYRQMCGKFAGTCQFFAGRVYVYRLKTLMITIIAIITVTIWAGIAQSVLRRAGRPGFDSLQEQGFCAFSTVFTSTLGPTKPPIQWVLGALSPEVKRPGREGHIHLVPRSRMVDLYLHSPIRLHGLVLN
jgi:hypothetical protein